MDERFSNGIIGGIAAGVIKDIPDALFHNWLKLTSLSFWDYAGQVALFRHPQGLGEHLYALAYEVLFSIFVGIIYVYLKDKLQTGHYLIRGAIYGALIWFMVNAVVLAFQIKNLIKTDPATSMVNSICSIIYGILLAYILHYLEEKRMRLDRM